MNIVPALQELYNPIIVSALFAWFFSQLTKAIIEFAEGEDIRLEIMYRTGGMPSSHAAFVVAIATSVYFLEGASNLFFVAVGFATIVVVDAFGVRQEVGTQAKLLNVLIKEIQFNLRKHDLRVLKELVGHSGLQVVGGIISGVLSAVIVNVFFF